jgi:hypothetical protein
MVVEQQRQLGELHVEEQQLALVQVHHHIGACCG